MKSYDYYYLAKRNLLPDAALRQRKIGTLSKSAKIHISAVCGKAMASIACMLAESGYNITGSDPSFYPPMSDVLVSHNIPCKKPSVENLDGVDLLVVGNMLPAHFLEVVRARELCIPMMSGSEVVAELFAGKRSLVLAGTHGKTTTSALLTHVFKTAERNPAYMIGGVFQGSENSYSLGSKDSTHVVYEGDEYDCAFFDKAPKFLRYNPTSAIITSIEHDHIDLYPTMPDYVQAFQFLVEDIPKDGFLVVHESALVHIDISTCQGKVITYGASATVDVRYHIEVVQENGTVFSVQTKDGKTYSDIHIPMFGEYNIANATAVIALALHEGLSIEDILSGIASYPGTRERQEIIGTKNDNIVVIRDFAHHPTAVSVTLQGLKSQYPAKRLVCVFEPRSITSRQKIFETEYPESLRQADISMVVTPPFKENNVKENFMDVSIIKNTLEAMNKVSYTAPDPNEALNQLREIVKPNDVVVFMSNGDFGGLPHKFLNL